MAQPQPEVETELRPGEFAIALVAAGTFFFGGWLGIFPAVWFLVVILNTRATPEHRRILLAPVRAARALPATVRALPGQLRAIPAQARALLTDDAETLDKGAVRNPTGAEFTPQPEPEPTRPAAPPTARSSRRPTAVLSPEQVATDPLFRTLDEEPHRLVIGHTRGGKTTAMHAMVRSWAHQGRPVYVLDPDAARGSWPGAIEVAGYAEDYEGIGTVVEQLRAIFDGRSELYADGQRDFEPLHIVADEVHETIRNVPGARDFLFETVGRRGAKRGIFLTLGTQGNNVDELGLDSAGVLNNFITAELERDERGRRRATVYRGNAARKKRVQEFAVPALTPARDYVRPTPVRQVEQLPLPEAKAPTAQLVRRAEEPAQAAPRPAPAAEPMPDLLAELLATMSPERAARLQALAPAEPPPAAQSVTVEREGGQVTVNVVQAAPVVSRRQRKKGGLNVEGRRLRLAYIEAARRGDKFDPTYKRLGGSRNEMHALFAAHKQN